MLKSGFIRETVNKSAFSEQCYYIFAPDANVSTDIRQLNLNDSLNTAESGLDQQQQPPPSMAPLPLGSGGSGGSGGIWGAGIPPQQHQQQQQQQQQPQQAPNWEMPWAGPPSGGSTTTYGPIYNPTAPPPSANYGMMPPYQAYPENTSFGYQVPSNQQQQEHLSSSGSGSHRSQRSNNRLMLAGSGSGSESASDGRASSIMGSDRSSLIRNPGLRPVAAGIYKVYFYSNVTELREFIILRIALAMVTQKDKKDQILDY
jgi:hypothetical protein